VLKVVQWFSVFKVVQWKHHYNSQNLCLLSFWTYMYMMFLSLPVMCCHLSIIQKNIEPISQVPSISPHKFILVIVNLSNYSVKKTASFFELHPFHDKNQSVPFSEPLICPRKSYTDKKVLYPAMFTVTSFFKNVDIACNDSIKLRQSYNFEIFVPVHKR
jgi:hypothetical protein